jgi:hypothetical protein
MAPGPDPGVLIGVAVVDDRGHLSDAEGVEGSELVASERLRRKEQQGSGESVSKGGLDDRSLVAQ